MSKMFYVGGEAGAGKTTLIRGALKEYPNNLHYLCTHTTRAPRDEPEPEYVFVSDEEYHNRRRASSQWDHDEIYGHSYGCDVAAANQTLLDGTSLIVSTVPDLEIVATMQTLYTEANPYIMYIKTPRQVRMSRLIARPALTEIARLEADGQMDSDAFARAADAIFEPPGGIEESTIAFNRIIGELLHG